MGIPIYNIEYHVKVIVHSDLCVQKGQSYLCISYVHIWICIEHIFFSLYLHIDVCPYIRKLLFGICWSRLICVHIAMKEFLLSPTFTALHVERQGTQVRLTSKVPDRWPSLPSTQNEIKEIGRIRLFMETFCFMLSLEQNKHHFCLAMYGLDLCVVFFCFGSLTDTPIQANVPWSSRHLQHIEGLNGHQTRVLGTCHQQSLKLPGAKKHRGGGQGGRGLEMILS